MATDTIYEKGDSLDSLAEKARLWFITNSVVVPSGAQAWQRCSVRRGEIPPGTGVTSLRRYGFNVTAFINSINQSTDKKPQVRNSITNSVLTTELGMELVSETTVNKHKRVTVRCLGCSREGQLDYGTLQRMRQANNRFCRVCRNAGGKSKPLEVYDKYPDYIPVELPETGRISYKHIGCGNTIIRTLAHITSAEYLVCEICYPRENFGARLYTDKGYFDSNIEYEAYLILLKYFDPNLIIRQKKYDELFNTKTKHTADFYIPTINLVLEVTSNYNNLGAKYKETAEWKKSLSHTVKFAYSLSEVEDIVRSAMKVAEVTVDNCGNVLRRCA